jgi:hypothetical protein
LGLTIEIPCYGLHFLDVLLRSKENHLKHHIIMLEASIDNSKVTTISSSIELTIEGVTQNFAFSFKAMINDACKALENNQCPQDWLNTQTFTMKKKLTMS